MFCLRIFVLEGSCIMLINSCNSSVELSISTSKTFPLKVIILLLFFSNFLARLAALLAFSSFSCSSLHRWKFSTTTRITPNSNNDYQQQQLQILNIIMYMNNKNFFLMFFNERIEMTEWKWVELREKIWVFHFLQK